MDLERDLDLDLERLDLDLERLVLDRLDLDLLRPPPNMYASMCGMVYYTMGGFFFHLGLGTLQTFAYLWDMKKWHGRMSGNITIPYNQKVDGGNVLVASSNKPWNI